jgi:hypothetical protein
MTLSSRQIDQTLAAIRQTQDTLMINLSTWLRSPTRACGERILEAKLGHDRAIDLLMKPE